jgi:PAS domain-containing protein
MRDQYRDKRELVTELTDLRKQVADLKQAAADRRRVEDGLRHDRELLHALLNQAPHPLCLLSTGGAPLLANHAFARMLGYASAGELVRLGRDLGVVMGDAALDDATAAIQPRDITFRRREGDGLVLPAISSVVPGTEYLAVTIVLNQLPA